MVAMSRMSPTGSKEKVTRTPTLKLVSITLRVQLFPADPQRRRVLLKALVCQWRLMKLTLSPVFLRKASYG